MKDYIIPIAVFLLLFISIQLEVNGVAPPTLGYILAGVALALGALAYQRHQSQYVRTMYMTVISVQLIFQIAIPYWIFSQSTAFNLTWPHYPDVLWATGALAIYYFLLSLIIVPVLVLLFGRRAWCSFACMLGAVAETLGDRYRTRGVKARSLPRSFLVLKWAILALTVAVTLPALAGYMEREAFLWLFLIIFVFILRATFSLAINIILMPRLGARIWCKFLCPQGLLLGILSSIGRFALVRDDHRCKSCGSCSKHCSMSIDIPGGPAVNRSGDCVGCGVCLEVCPHGALSMSNDSWSIRKKEETYQLPGNQTHSN